MPGPLFSNPSPQATAEGHVFVASYLACFVEFCGRLDLFRRRTPQSIRRKCPKLGWFDFAAISALMLPARLLAQASTYSQPVGADTFVSSGQPDMNFGSLAAMEIAGPTASQARTELALLQFDTSALTANFDAAYGSGAWRVTSVTLTLFSNVSLAGQQPNNPSFNRIAPGGFELALFSNNDWDENGITWNTLSGLLPGPGNNNTLPPLGTFFWDAAGEGVSTWQLDSDAQLAQAIYGGGLVTVLGQPTAGSTIGYLFNTQKLNPGYWNVTAEPVPEPSILALVTAFICMGLISRARIAARGNPLHLDR